MAAASAANRPEIRLEYRIQKEAGINRPLFALDLL
jgi:hypothetical protein